MPQYFNLSLYSSSENLMSMYTATDTLMKGFFSLFLVVVIFMFIFVFRNKKGDELQDCLIISSFWSLMVSMILYTSQVFYTGMNKPGLYLFLPAIILVISAAVKWYNNR